MKVEACIENEIDSSDNACDTGTTYYEWKFKDINKQCCGIGDADTSHECNEYKK